VQISLQLAKDRDAARSRLDMQRVHWAVIGGAVLAGVIGCSGDGPGLRVGMSAPEGGGSAGTAGIDNPSADASGGFDVMEHALAVEIQHEALAVELVTLRCAGECAEVEAVASGGHPPYEFAWDDGPTAAARMLCPEETAAFGVAVTDTGFETEEFTYQANTERAEVTARVLECSDGGMPMPQACIENPSLEGVVTPGQLEAFDAAGWNACYAGGIAYAAIGNATLWPFQNWAFPDASDGDTYLALGQQLAFVGRASQTLCEPLEAGAARSFFVDLARATTTDTGESHDQVLEILGGTAECAEETVLWTSPQLTLEWQTHCVTLRPEQTVTTLAFRPVGRDGGLVEALVDNIRPVSACP
jgi:hypothetical protein